MGYGITERRQSASLFIEVNNESVQNVLKEIECQSEYSFFYDNQKINTSRKVSIRSDGEDVFSILKSCLRIPTLRIKFWTIVLYCR